MGCGFHDFRARSSGTEHSAEVDAATAAEFVRSNTQSGVPINRVRRARVGARRARRHTASVPSARRFRLPRRSRPRSCRRKSASRRCGRLPGPWPPTAAALGRLRVPNDAPLEGISRYTDDALTERGVTRPSPQSMVCTSRSESHVRQLARRYPRSSKGQRHSGVGGSAHQGFHPAGDHRGHQLQIPPLGALRAGEIIFDAHQRASWFFPPPGP